MLIYELISVNKICNYWWAHIEVKCPTPRDSAFPRAHWLGWDIWTKSWVLTKRRSRCWRDNLITNGRGEKTECLILRSFYSGEGSGGDFSQGFRTGAAGQLMPGIQSRTEYISTQELGASQIYLKIKNIKTLPEKSKIYEVIKLAYSIQLGNLHRSNELQLCLSPWYSDRRVIGEHNPSGCLQISSLSSFIPALWDKYSRFPDEDNKAQRG